jgi:hypothetical protein
MTELSGTTPFSRIEDFIALARKGKTVTAMIDVEKQLVTQKVHPEATEEMKQEISMYLLIAVYTFKVGKDVTTVSKVYLYGSAEASLRHEKIDKSIANERLKMDYQRLRKAHIKFEETYF